MTGEKFLRDGVMMVRVPDGREFRVSDVMRLNNPGMEYDDMTGEAMAMTPPRGGGGSSKPREYTFGDVGSETLARTIDDVSSTAGGGGEITRSLLPEDWRQTFPDAMLAAGDYGLAGLLGLLGAAETGAGYAGDVVEGAQGLLGIDSGYRPGGSARGFQRALMGMAEGAGYAPEGRMIASLTEAGAPRAAARAVVDRLNQPGQMPTTYSNPIPGLLGDASSAAADPAIQRADEVLGLLKSGRADEVTDAMLDMGDPVLNARLNEHLYRNYDLPMDEASRMQRADQYWPDDAYHATGSDFSAFDPLKRGTATDSGWFGDADYFSPKPEYAAKFAPVTTDSANIIPARLNRGSVYDWRAMEADRGGRGVGNNRDASMAARARLEGEGFDSVEVSNPILRGDITDELWTAMVAADPQVEAFGRDNVARSFGAGIPKDSLKPYFNKEMLDLVPAQRDVEEIAIFDPRNIRSAFARFDPRLSHLRNLNAALAAGVPLGLLSMSEEE